MEKRKTTQQTVNHYGMILLFHEPQVNEKQQQKASSTIKSNPTTHNNSMPVQVMSNILSHIASGNHRDTFHSQ